MGFEGLIFVVIAAAWLVYLVPLILYRNVNGLLDEVDHNDDLLTPSVVVVCRGIPLDVVDEATSLVSTPLNRRAALRELDEVDARAAVRRRTVLGVLLSAVTVTGVLAATGRAPLWSVAIPTALIVGFLLIARVTVVRMREGLARRADEIRLGGHTEQTVAIQVLKDVEPQQSSIDLAPPKVVVSSLLDPIPITKPTYVSKPLAPRTVRTIDLSAPVPTQRGGLPVTADALPVEASGDELGGQAVNE